MGTDKANATRDVADGVVDGVVDSPEDDVTGSAAQDDKAAGDPVNGGRPVAESGREGDQAAAGTGDGGEGANAESALAGAATVEVPVVAEADSSPPQVTAPAPETPPADDVSTPPLGTPAPPPHDAQPHEALPQDAPPQDAPPSAARQDAPPVSPEQWREHGDWQAAAPEHPADLAHASERHGLAHPDDLDHDEEEWYEEYQDVALFAAIFSAPSLALAAFIFALTGLLGGMIPQSLPYLVDPLDPQANPAFLLGLIMLGFAIVAASLGLAAMLRSIGSPLNWPRYLGGAAVLLALLMALQSVLLIVLAGQNAGPDGMS